MGQLEGGQWLADDLMTCWSLKAQQHWPELDCRPLTCSPAAHSSLRLPHSQGLQASQAEMEPGSPFSLFPVASSGAGTQSGG